MDCGLMVCHWNLAPVCESSNLSNPSININKSNKYKNENK